MRGSRRSLMPLACLALALLGRGSASAQDAAPELKARFHVDLRGAEENNPMLRIIGEAVRWEGDGARIKLTAGQREAVNPGIATRFSIHGDFDITASYAILQVDKPSEGYGVGVTLYAAIDPKTDHAVSLSRRVLKGGNTMFLANRMNRGAKAKDRLTSAPSTSKTGRFRLKRVGSKIQFMVADGAKADFVMMAEEEFDRAEVRFLQFGGNAGNSASGLDLRLLDLTVAAEDLPGLEVATPDRPDVPGQAEPRPGGRSWLLAVVFISVSLLVLIVVTAGVGVYLMRRGAATTPQASVDPDQRAQTDRAYSLSFACAGCGKKLKVKEALAGKKVKCTHCGKIIPAPQADVFEADQAS